MGGAYINLGKLDSAKWSVDKGLRFLPEDLQLLNVAAFVAKKQSRFDDQLYYLDKKLQLEEEIEGLLSFTNDDSDEQDIIELQKSLGFSSGYIDGQWSESIEKSIATFRKSRYDTYKLLSDYYKDQGLFEDQIDILDEWQAIDPENSSIFKLKKSAYVSLGRNPIDIDKDRWRKDPSNIKFGLDYIRKLKEESDLDKIVEVALALSDFEPNNTLVLENLGQAYLDLYELEKSLRVYEKLIKLDNKNVSHFISISKIYSDIGEYSKSTEFADKAISISASADSYYNRAQIYKNIVEACRQEVLSMSDKAVYEMAWEDLKVAIEKGNRRAKKDASFLEKNFITKNMDWFRFVEDGKKTFKPSDPCYEMIDRKITKRNF
jgi:tetratricopeptide (TPR) repeat protein